MKDNKYCKFANNCHCTGEYRGGTHSICNLKYSVPKKMSVVFIMDLTMTVILL